MYLGVKVAFLRWDPVTATGLFLMASVSLLT